MKVSLADVIALRRIAKRLRMLAHKFERQWVELTAVPVDCSQGMSVTWKRDAEERELIEVYYSSAGMLLLDAFEHRAFRQDYQLCSIIGNFRQKRNREIRLILKKHDQRRFIKGLTVSVFVRVQGFWRWHPRRGIDWRWRYRYLTAGERFSFVCQTLADYLEAESERFEQSLQNFVQEPPIDLSNEPSPSRSED